MINPNDLALKYIPFFDHFAHENITSNGEVIGHNVFLISRGRTLGGGTAAHKGDATQIALAEALERRTMTLAPDNELKLLKFDDYPTSCGFAAGFNQETTKMRSVCEAVERWAWEQWIDHRFPMQPTQPNKLSRLGEHFLSPFDKVLFFEKDLLVSSGENLFSLKFNVVIGLKEYGAFPGSRVTASNDDGWEHGCIESNRHLKIYEDELKNSEPQDFIDARIKFFGSHKDIALKSIEVDSLKVWPLAHLSFSKKLNTPADFHVFRSLCNNFKGWHTGKVTRFVY